MCREDLLVSRKVLDLWDRDHLARANLDKRKVIGEPARPSAYREPASVGRPAGQLRSLHGDPRWGAFLAKMGFEA